MPYRTTSFTNAYFYHIFNRGVEKRNIFLNDKDRYCFLKTLFYYHFAPPRPRFSRFNPKIHTKLPEDKTIEIVCFCLMPNHFHLLLKQNMDNGISDFLRKVSNSYTKYFNIKHNRVGPLLQGVFKAVPVESDEQLMHLSRYIHLNPYVAGLTKSLDNYPWSSYTDFLQPSKSLITKGEILSLFSSPKEYEKFVLDYEDYALKMELIKHQLIDIE